MNNLIIDGDFSTVALWFAAYCFLGWVWESAYRSIKCRKLVNSGFLTGPYVPIYGFGALLYIFLMHFTLNPIILFFVGGLTACILEYVTSWLLEKIFHARWWDYSDSFMNINGRICLIGFCAFAAFAVILPYIQLGVGQLINLMTSGWRIATVIIFATTILYDAYKTSRGLVKFNKTLARYQEEIEKHAAPLVDIIRKGKRTFEMHFAKGREKTREILTYQQRRIMAAFPGFESIQYPDAFKKIRKLYEDSRYKPQRVKTKKKK